MLPFLYTVPRYSHDETSNQCSTEQGKNHGFWEKAGCDPTAYFTLWLVAFTGVLAVSTIGLWIVTARGVRIQSADTRILQRAYLSVEPFGVHPMKQVAKFSIPHIQISNVGKLPAKHVRWLIHHAASEDHDRKVFRIDEGDAKGDITLSPGVIMQQGGDLVDVATELKLPFGWYLYVWGAAYYIDGFGENRITRFCHRYNCVNTTEIMHPGGHPSGYKIENIFARYNRWGNDAT
jgi:hypothetical protein